MPCIFRVVGQVGVIAALIVVFQAASVPSPALFGAFMATALISILGWRKVEVPAVVGRAAQSVLGATIATQIDGEQLRAVGSGLPLLIAVAISIIAVSVMLGRLLVRQGVSRMTAMLASIAGGASAVTPLADELGADRRVVAVVQYLRVVLVLVTLGVVMSGVDSNGAGSSIAAQPETTVSDYMFAALVMSAGVGAGLVPHLPAPALIGSLISGGLLLATPAFANAEVPGSVGVVALGAIGAQAASGFTRQTFHSLRGLLPMALVSSVLLIAVCAGIGVVYSAMANVSYLDGYLATSPGGLPVVLATVVDIGGDAAVVSSSQLIRLLAVVILLPIVVAATRWRRDR